MNERINSFFLRDFQVHLFLIYFGFGIHGIFSNYWWNLFLINIFLFYAIKSIEKEKENLEEIKGDNQD